MNKLEVLKLLLELFENPDSETYISRGEDPSEWVISVDIKKVIEKKISEEINK